MTSRRNDDPTDAEIDRSLARMEHALGPGFADDDGVIHEYGPGFHFDMPSARYFNDPCQRPSLTQSIAKVLIDRSPAHAYIAHPRLNPRWQPDDDTKYDVGNIAHRLLLGRGKDILVVEFDDWRTKDARAARDDAAKGGQLAVLEKHHRMATAIVNAARSQLVDIGWLPDFENGRSEVVVIAEEGPTILRSMIDLMTGPRLCTDLKTTGLSAAPHAIPNLMASAGWAVQAAMQERILDILDPPGRGRRVFRFIAIEDMPPYALTPVELTEATMTMGRKMVDAAVNLWRACIEADLWPAYGTEVLRPTYPGWAETRWLDREIEDGERTEPRRGGMIPSLMGG